MPDPSEKKPSGRSVRPLAGKTGKTPSTSPVTAPTGSEKSETGPPVVPKPEAVWQDLETAVASDAAIRSYRDQIAQLEASNRELQAQIDKLQRPPTAPEDFASSVQQALDQLQTQLQRMKNPVSNFAVKEFTLETNVHITVTPLGTVEYRFVPFDHSIDPSTLSRITLQLVPIPKQAVTETYLPGSFVPQTGVDEIVGLSSRQVRALHESGIYSVGELVQIGTRARTLLQLEGLLHVERVKVAHVLASAELMTLRGIDGSKAAILIAAGVDSLAKVAALTPEDLAAKIKTPLSDAGALVKAAAGYVGQCHH